MRQTPLSAALLLAFCAPLAFASTSGVVISQVYGGGGNTGSVYKSDFIELRNAGSAPVSLNGWSVQYASATGSSWGVTALTNVTLQPGQYYLVQQSTGSGGTTNLPTADATGTFTMSATAGKVALVTSTTALTGTNPTGATLEDLVGYGTTAGAFEGSTGPAPAPSATLADVRAAAGCTDTNDNKADFMAVDAIPRNSATSYTACAGSGGGSGGGSDTTVSLSIPQIQGTGRTSAHVGRAVRTQGVVTLVTNNSFYMQDLVGDGNPATSDGILVFTSTKPTVAAGQLVSLVGTVAEFNTGAAGNADTVANTVTQLTTISQLQVLGTGYSITPVNLTLPLASRDDFERVEGMLVNIAGPLTVSQNYFLGRFGQLTLSAGRLETPTNKHRPGSSQALALAALNARSRVMLDDATSLQNPNPTPWLAGDNTVRAGDTLSSVTGVVDFGLASSTNTEPGDWKIQPVQVGTFSRANARTVVPPKVGGNLKLGSFNVLNYFTTFTNGNTASGQTGQGCTLGNSNAASNCRGASNLAEFNRQRSKIIEAMAAIDADALGLMEIQNNGSTAVQNLVDGLNARVGAGTYAAVPDPAAGTGTDAIKVAMIYKPGKLTRVGASQSDTAAINNRPPLAQTFAAANGEKFTLVVNHLKSKGSCPAAGDPDAAGNTDAGDGQGCWNAQRVAQAQRLATWLPTATAGAPDALMVGDFNAYAQEDPINALTSTGFVDQIGRYNSFGYSYVFDGAAGRLDHALTTASMSAKVTRAVEWHINADEPAIIDYNTEFKQPACATCGPDYYTATPYRSSDHDPVVLGLQLSKVIQGTSGRDTLTGSAGDDTIIGGEGADTLTGGAGVNTYVYNSIRDAGDTITDFAPGKDLIDLRNLLASLGWTGTDAVTDGLVRLQDVAIGCAVQIDTDGPTGTAAFRTLVTLRGVSASQLVVSRDLVQRATVFAERKKK
ncbi:ExeM/NucH family extracellular endonuclease [Ideonella margarita]|uniref:ExeM/NucH family extracellular endonuclease n=1 Tax=Ideonella margarita TaxID=2984191 RepID=A0ABU9C0F6_9BURK